MCVHVLWLLDWVGRESTWSFIADHMSPGQLAASEGGWLDLWISQWILAGGGYIDQ